MESEDHKELTPEDFNEYLTWACQQQVSRNVIITKEVQDEYISIVNNDRKGKSKSRKLPVEESLNGSISLTNKFKYPTDILDDIEQLVQMHTIYDANNKLIEIIFQNNKYIPRKILIILTLIVQFHPTLTIIKINKGLDGYIMHELRKLLNVSNITEVHLDDTYLKSPNYHILLETPSSLKQLSLKRCKINDDVVKDIAQTLMYPNDAAKNLFILNLGTNVITDVGAKYLAEALRSNRNLAYLNLCDNSISDDGAVAILNSLVEFQIEDTEIVESRARLVEYLKNKTELINRLISEMKCDDKKTVKKKTKIVPKVKVIDKESSLQTVAERKSIVDIYYDKAVAIADSVMGEFDDPFQQRHVLYKNNILYCKGNNNLAYLNLAFNNLSYISVKKLLDVVSEQKLNNRRPRGLVNVNIDGNYLPKSCLELIKINDILESGFMVRRMSLGVKKKLLTKGIK